MPFLFEVLRYCLPG